MEQQGASILGSLLPLIIIFVIFYFLIIRPQQIQQKKHKEMVEGLKKGDKIVTTGGIIAEVVKNEENHIKAKISDNTEVKIDKAYIAKKLES